MANSGQAMFPKNVVRLSLSWVGVVVDIWIPDSPHIPHTAVPLNLSTGLWKAQFYSPRFVSRRRWLKVCITHRYDTPGWVTVLSGNPFVPLVRVSPQTTLASCLIQTKGKFNI